MQILTQDPSLSPKCIWLVLRALKSPKLNESLIFSQIFMIDSIEMHGNNTNFVGILLGNSTFNKCDAWNKVHHGWILLNLILLHFFGIEQKATIFKLKSLV